MTDDEIMAGMAENDPKGFSAFERKFKERIYAVARRVFNYNISNETLEELFYEVLFIVWEKLSKGEKINKLSAFVAIVARNKSVDLLNYEKKHTHLEKEKEQKTGDPGPEDETIKNDLIKIIKDHIKLLDPVEQEIIRLRFNEELRFHEIAKKLSMNTPAVGQRLRRSLIKLRKMLEDKVDH